MECRKQLCEKCKKKEDDYFLVTLYYIEIEPRPRRKTGAGLFWVGGGQCARSSPNNFPFSSLFFKLFVFLHLKNYQNFKGA